MDSKKNEQELKAKLQNEMFGIEEEAEELSELDLDAISGGRVKGGNDLLPPPPPTHNPDDFRCGQDGF